MLRNIKKGIIILEISTPSPERFLNLLWVKKVKVANARRINITTLRLMIEYRDYKLVEEVVKISKGKLKIVDKKGSIFFFHKLKNRVTLVLGSIIFITFLYFLSTFVWVIEIKTGENVPPYEIRQNLKELGIEPGINKNELDVYALEKKIESINSNVLWIRARIEGSTLKIVVEEKVNPPVNSEAQFGDCTALLNGEIKRIFVSSGTALVLPGDFVKEGDVLIQSTQGQEESKYQVPARGIIIANTFYEREMEVQISGKTLKKTGRKDSDIYIKFQGKKIYLKKAINNFVNYDKIERSEGILNTVTYFEKEEVEVMEDKESAIINATHLLEESLQRNLTNTAKIIKKDVFVENIYEGKIRVKVTFVVEQDIAHTIT
jgi:similar to stage IV sporulation protein